MTKIKQAGLFLGVFGFLLPLFIQFPGLSLAGHLAMSIFLLAAVFWMFETIPIYATSILVIFSQALLLSAEGIIDYTAIANYDPVPYTHFIGTLADPIIILFLGGFILADASVKYDFDKNLTRILLSPFGNRPATIILGLMAVTAVLSSFMSNTATTAMMVTIIIPIISKMEPEDPARIAVALSVPFAANIGGIATPIGTPPNAIVIAALNQQGIDIAFSSWMIYALPLAVIMLLFAWQVLLRLYPPSANHVSLNLDSKFQKSNHAYLLYATFVITVLLWITEGIHGIKSSIVALLPVTLLTLSSAVTKQDIRKLPWDVLWLMAGGIALGISMRDTGLAEWMVSGISWGDLSRLMVLVMFGAVALIMSNFLSNTVTASLLVPIAITLVTSGALKGVLGMLLIGLVIALSASFAMLLPISTPPNAIAESTGMVKTKHMLVSGSIIGIVGLMLVLLLATFYWPLIV